MIYIISLYHEYIDYEIPNYSRATETIRRRTYLRYLCNRACAYNNTYLYTLSALNRICLQHVFEEALHTARQRILRGNETVSLLR